MTDVLKKEAAVIGKTQEIDVEIRDIEETTTKDEVKESLEKVIDKDYVVAANAVKSLRRTYGETQIAHVRLPAQAARNLIGASSAATQDILLGNARAISIIKSWTAPMRHTTSYVLIPIWRNTAYIYPADKMRSLLGGLQEKNHQTTMKVLQYNLNHCETAQDLLMETARDWKIDVVIITDPYKPLRTNQWASGATEKSSIWSCGKLLFQHNIDST